MKTIGLLAISLLMLFASSSRATEPKPASLDDLKKLEIICFVPSYLPQGFRVRSVRISYDDAGPNEDAAKRLPLYQIEWGNGEGASFSIDCAREGIGDRNIMETEDAEDAEFQSPLFGRVYIIYTPKGKGEAGGKKEINSNWVMDANMQAETEKDASAHPILGRFHGFTGRRMTVAEFSKIVNSFHPIRGDGKTALKSPPPLKIHPKIFNMIDCWVSDSVSPVVTEINLDAVEMNKNQFDMDAVKADGEWTRSPTKEDGGFMRYRVLGLKDNRYTVEYQENGGGSLTTDSTIEFTIEKRTIQRDGKPATISVLRVLSYKSK
jgi:hypothetical protein